MIYEKEINIDIDDYPDSSSFLSNLNKERAIVLTKNVQKYIDEISFLFTVKSYKLPFGILSKGKNINAINYSRESKIFIDKLRNNPSEEVLKEALVFWENHKKIDLGKKLKQKHKNRLIYSSLTSISILLKDFDKAKMYHRKLYQNSSIFNNYTLNIDNLFRDENISNQFKITTNNRFDTVGNFLYESVFIKKGKYLKVDEEIEFDQIIVQKLLPRTNRNEKIISLKLSVVHEKPKVKLYKDGKLLKTIYAKINHSIKLESGDLIKFITEKGVNIPYLYKLDKFVVKL